MKKTESISKVNEEEEESEDEEDDESSTEELETTFSHLSVSHSGKENYDEYNTTESHFVPLKPSIPPNRVSTGGNQNQVLMTFSRTSTQQSNESNRNNSSSHFASTITTTTSSSSSSSSSTTSTTATTGLTASSSFKKHSSSPPSPPSPAPSAPVLLPSTIKTPLPLPSTNNNNVCLSGEKVRIDDINNNNKTPIKTEASVTLPSSYKEKSNSMKMIQPQLKQNPVIKEQSKNQLKEEIKNISVIFDTNYFLDFLDNVESYLKRSLKVYNNKHSTLQSLVSMLQPYYFMIVPQQVIVELDGLKLSNNSNTASKARRASRMLVDSLSQYKDKILFLQNDSEIY